jgi:dTDP-4-amino-4,6-dideoxygalactose transaminase
MAMTVRVGEFRVDDPIRKAVDRVMESGRVSEWRETRCFEQSFAEYAGTKHAVALNSGTSALVAGLLALKPRLGGSNLNKSIGVVTSPLTYVATANAIVLSGMEPLFADVDMDSLCVDPQKVEELLETKPGGNSGLLLPVHLMGYVCDMTRMRKIASKHGLRVVEDSSQAHGSLHRGRRAGSMSDLSTFSFYIAHNIQAGELGAVLTNDREIARRVRKIKANGRMCDCTVCTRDQGRCPKFGKGKGSWDPRFLHDEVGYNFKTMEFPAAIAAVQISRADEIASKRRQNVRMLNDLLSPHEDLIRLPVYSRDVSYLGYPVVINKPRRINREKLQVSLESKGVETRPLFGCIPVHQPAYSHLKKRYKGRLPNAEYLGANGLYIGCHQYLTEEDLHLVADAFSKSLKKIIR